MQSSGVLVRRILRVRVRKAKPLQGLLIGGTKISAQPPRTRIA